MSASNPAAPLADHQNKPRDTNVGSYVQSAEDFGFDNGPSFDAAVTDFDFTGAPDLAPMEGGLTGNNYSYGNNEMIQSNNNHFNGQFDEARTAKTPGYNFDNFDNDLAEYQPDGMAYQPEDMVYQPDDMAYQRFADANDGYHYHSAKTPFQSSDAHDGHDGKTPYVPPSPYESLAGDYDHVTELSFNNSNNTQSADSFVPLESPLVANFASPTSSLPATKPASAKKTPKKTPKMMPEETPKKTPISRVKSRAKSRAKAPVIEDDSGQDDKEEGHQNIPTTRSKGEGRAKAVVAQEDGGDEDDEDEPPKTRSSARSKAKAKPKAKAKGKGRAVVEENDAEGDEDEDGDSHMQSTPAAASSVKGKGRASKASASTSSRQPTASTPKKSALKKTPASALKTMGHQRLRAAPKNGIVNTKPIPNSFEECDEGDKALITTRDAGGTWAECKARYFEITGINHGNSTLPNRYERLKTAFINMRDEDNVNLFDAKKKVEEDFNSTKWDMISQTVADKAGIHYDPMDLKRRFRQLMEKTGFPVNEGLARKDVDFMPAGADDEEEVEDTSEPARSMPNIEWDNYGGEEDTVGGAEQEYHDNHEDTEDVEYSRFGQHAEQDYMDLDDDDEEADRGLDW